MESIPSATIQGDKMYGLGTCDDKASIAAMVTAYLEIAGRGDKQKGTVDLLISVDEEGDGKGVKAAISQGYKCDYAIVGEPTNLDIVHAHNGLLFYTLVTEGVAAHGSYPQLGVNSVDRMMQLVGELRDNVAKLASHPATGPSSLNLGEIHAGDRPNRVPEKCTARIDIRFPPPATNDQVLEATKEIIKSHEWAQYIVEKRGETLDTPLDSPLIRIVKESGRSLGASCKMVGLRGWTEAEPFRTLLGIDAVVFGPGNIQQAHTSNEFTSISQTQLAAQIYADIAQLLGDELARS
jgi:acetylornithine deacetylase/succinyl-diaminopimelate desuccinylase-like protein